MKKCAKCGYCPDEPEDMEETAYSDDEDVSAKDEVLSELIEMLEDSLAGKLKKDDDTEEG